MKYSLLEALRELRNSKKDESMSRLVEDIVYDEEDDNTYLTDYKIFKVSFTCLGDKGTERALAKNFEDAKKLIFNDISELEDPTVKIKFKNAPDEVIDVADFIAETDNNPEDIDNIRDFLAQFDIICPGYGANS